MASFYSNENFPLPVVEALRILGHDVLTVKEAGNAEQAISDEAVLSFAHAHKRAVLTINRKHFIRLHRAISEHSGIVICTYDPQFTEQAERIHASVSELSNLEGVLLRVNRPLGNAP